MHTQGELDVCHRQGVESYRDMVHPAGHGQYTGMVRSLSELIGLTKAVGVYPDGVYTNDIRNLW
jgi:hypothetical protein